MAGSKLSWLLTDEADMWDTVDRKSRKPRRLSVSEIVEKEMTLTFLPSLSKFDDSETRIRLKRSIERLLMSKYYLEAQVEEKNNQIEDYDMKTLSIKMDKVEWKRKFFSLKYLLVVRSDIESYEKYLTEEFPFDQDLFDEKEGLLAKSEEERRQQWKWLLNNSIHERVTMFRRELFIRFIKSDSALKLALTTTAKNYHKKLHQIYQAFVAKSPEFADWDEFDQINHLFADTRVRRMKVEDAAHTGLPDGEDYVWFADLFGTIAAQIAKLYREICAFVLTVKFEADATIPPEFQIFRTAEYVWIIEIFMSSYRNLVDDEEDKL